MASYKTVRGDTIQSFSSDPSNPLEGQVWYNSTSNVLKGYASVAGAWATGGVLPNYNGNYGACGTLSASIIAGGYNGPVGKLNATVEYDGTSWTAVNNLPALRDWNSCFGILTAAVNVGGIATPPGVHQATVEEYDGTNWTAVTALPTAIVGEGTAGALTAGLVMGGSTPSNVPGSPASFEYDGTNWTSGGVLTTGRYRTLGQSIGTQTAALYVGGLEGPAPGQAVEAYDGTSWTAGGSLNTARDLGGGNGIQTSALAVSGRGPGPTYTTTAVVEEYNGTSWTASTSVSTGRAYCSTTGSGAGTVGNTESLFIGGATTGSTPDTTATEEWTSGLSVITFTSS